MVHAQVEPRRYNPELLDLVVTRVEFLAEIKTSGISEIVVAVNVENLDEMEVDEFLTLIENNPGKTNIQLSFTEPGKFRNVRVKSIAKKVNIDRHLVDFLKQSKAFRNYELVSAD